MICDDGDLGPSDEKLYSISILRRLRAVSGNSYERMFVMPQIIAALIGASAVGLGWLVTFLLQQHSKSLEQRRMFLIRQMEEFYYPLLALVQKKIDVQTMQDQRLAHESGTSWVTIFQHFEDNYTVPLMLQIGELLRTKPYLAIDWPPSFDQYLHHESQSVPLYDLWRKTGIPGEIETVRWPPTIEDDIKARKNLLETQLKRLYKIGPPVQQRGMPTKIDQRPDGKVDG